MKIKEKGQIKNKKAISLIVLIITILVLSILASVVIVSLSNANIIEQAQDTVSKAQRKQIEEAKEIMLAQAMLETTPENQTIGSTILMWDENSQTVLEKSVIDGKEYINGVVIPDKFYYVGGTKDSGLVISDSEADEYKGVSYECEGNQFVWIPVDDYDSFVAGSGINNFCGFYGNVRILYSNRQRVA